MRTASSIRSTPSAVMSPVSSGWPNESATKLTAPQVVDLVGLHLLDSRDQGRQVLQVALDQLKLGRLLLDHADLGIRLTSDHPVDVVPLLHRSWAM